jgi:hypothetical protein
VEEESMSWGALAALAELFAALAVSISFFGKSS